RDYAAWAPGNSVGAEAVDERILAEVESEPVAVSERQRRLPRRGYSVGVRRADRHGLRGDNLKGEYRTHELARRSADSVNVVRRPEVGRGYRDRVRAERG